jgi:hypothetical protein
MRIRWRPFALLLVSIAPATGWTRPVEAQRRDDARWAVNLAFTALSIKGADWGWGPELTVRRNLGDRWGGIVRFTAPAAGTNGGGAAIDLGPSRRWDSGDEELSLTAGASWFVLRESSAIGSRVGLFVTFHYIGWFGDWIGLLAQSHARLTFDGRTYPGFALGAAIRF